MYIINKTKAVRVLKSYGKPALRLFPGFNTIPEKVDLADYLSTPVAKAVAKECLEIVETAAPDKMEEGKAAMRKNIALNKEKRAQGPVKGSKSQK